MNTILLKVSSSLFCVLLFLSTAVHSKEKEILIKPFTLAKIYKNAKKASIAFKVRNQLVDAGFNIVGTYQPYEATTIFVITDKSLLRTAAKTQYGGFGAGLRVSVTQVNDDVQVAHNNPVYIGIAYRMNSKLETTREELAKTLGFKHDFGGKGITAEKLSEYKYGAGLEKFTGFMELAQHKTHKEALEYVQTKLIQSKKNMKKVYRLDIPGKQQSVFGISLKSDKKKQPFLNDQFVMNIIDHKYFRRSAHLPYEIMVMDNRVLMMHPHFRIAVNFPDVRMFGKNSFGKLLDLPYKYEEFFVQLAGGNQAASGAPR